MVKYVQYIQKWTNIITMYFDNKMITKLKKNLKTFLEFKCGMRVGHVSDVQIHDPLTTTSTEDTFLN